MNSLRTYPKKLLWRLYWVFLALSLILGFYWLYAHVFHYHFSIQNIPQFFAILGWGGCMVLILVSKVMASFMVVEEDYYEKREERVN